MGAGVGYALGVDVGTTFTAAAIARADRRVDVVPLGSRAPQVPTVVFVRIDGAMLVGEAADRRTVSEPTRVIRGFKRRVGDPTPLMVGGAPFSPEDLLVSMLMWAVGVVTEREGAPPDRIVITHPANWTSFKKGLLSNALGRAGLTNVGFITEPEAAAVWHSTQERVSPGQVVAVYDLGGGTFDTAMLRKTEAGFDFLGAPEGIEELGGVDFDEKIVGHVAEQLDLAGDLDSADPQFLSAMARLHRDCVEAKEALSDDTETVISVNLPSITTSVRLTRGEFETMIAGDLDKTVNGVQHALSSAHLKPDDVAAVVLVGGSARIPLVSQALAAALARPLAVSNQPKHAVAMGAAFVAATSGGQPAMAPAPTDEATSRAAVPIPVVPAPTEPAGAERTPRARRPRISVGRLSLGVVDRMLVGLSSAAFLLFTALLLLPLYAHRTFFLAPYTALPSSSNIATVLLLVVGAVFVAGGVAALAALPPWTVWLTPAVAALTFLLVILRLASTGPGGSPRHPAAFLAVVLSLAVLVIVLLDAVPGGVPSALPRWASYAAFAAAGLLLFVLVASPWEGQDNWLAVSTWSGRLAAVTTGATLLGLMRRAWPLGAFPYQTLVGGIVAVTGAALLVGSWLRDKRLGYPGSHFTKISLVICALLVLAVWGFAVAAVLLQPSTASWQRPAVIGGTVVVSAGLVLLIQPHFRAYDVVYGHSINAKAGTQTVQISGNGQCYTKIFGPSGTLREFGGIPSYNLQVGIGDPQGYGLRFRKDDYSRCAANFSASSPPGETFPKSLNQGLGDTGTFDLLSTGSSVLITARDLPGAVFVGSKSSQRGCVTRVFDADTGRQISEKALAGSAGSGSWQLQIPGARIWVTADSRCAYHISRG
jgi:actin-like ATPase involved in cell morphogenesis